MYLVLIYKGESKGSHKHIYHLLGELSQKEIISLVDVISLQDNNHKVRPVGYRLGMMSWVP